MRALAFALVLTAAAHAWSAPTADDHYQASKRLYEVAEYDKAIAELKQAYMLSPDPVYLFNIAQAYRKKGDCALAIEFYAKYLKASPKAANRARVEGWIQELASCATKPEPVPEPEPPKPVPKPVPKPAPVPRVVPPPPPPRGAALRIASVATVGTGLVALALGTTFAISARGIQRDIEADCLDGCDWGMLDAVDARGERRALYSRIAFGVGGAAVIGGAVMYFVDRKARNEPRVGVVPASGGGAVVVSGRF